MEEVKKSKRSKSFAATIGTNTYRQILLKLNQHKKQTGQNNITIDIKEVGGMYESWLNYGSNSILLEDSVLSKQQAMTAITQLRRYLLDRKFNVYVKADE